MGIVPGVGVGRRCKAPTNEQAREFWTLQVGDDWNRDGLMLSTSLSNADRVNQQCPDDIDDGPSPVVGRVYGRLCNGNCSIDGGCFLCSACVAQPE